MELFESAWTRVEGLPEVEDNVASLTEVGTYRLGEELGRGEFAVVQRCTNTAGAEYAIKHIAKRKLICRRSTARTLRRIRRLGSEITVMRALHHRSASRAPSLSPARVSSRPGLGSRGARRAHARGPALGARSNICRLIDVFHSPEYVHLVMEKGGTDLYEFMDQRAVLDAPLAHVVSQSMLRALEHCLEHGVVHRDIKPENILVHGEVDAPAARLRVHLCDFGLYAIAPTLAATTGKPAPPTAPHPLKGAGHRSPKVACGGEAGAGRSPSPSNPQEDSGSEDKSRGSSASASVAGPHAASACGGDAAAAAPAAAEKGEILAEISQPKGVERNWHMSEFSGSPGFVAPEVLSSSRKLYDSRLVDTWSLGCVLLEARARAASRARRRDALSLPARRVARARSHARTPRVSRRDLPPARSS